jgi:hypothetical protein
VAESLPFDAVQLSVTPLSVGPEVESPLGGSGAVAQELVDAFAETRADVLPAASNASTANA